MILPSTYPSSNIGLMISKELLFTYLDIILVERKFLVEFQTDFKVGNFANIHFGLMLEWSVVFGFLLLLIFTFILDEFS
jgi:hypothetical protein